MNQILEQIDNGKAALIRDGIVIEMMKHQRSDLNIAIGQEKYLPALMGYPVKRKKSDSIKRLNRM